MTSQQAKSLADIVTRTGTERLQVSYVTFGDDTYSVSRVRIQYQDGTVKVIRPDGGVYIL